MLNNLKLTRPLVFLDLETTGTRPEEDRIIELFMHRICSEDQVRMGGAEWIKMHILANPGIPISPEATAVNGFTNEQASKWPKFVSFAKAAAEFMEDCDLAGFGIKRFDLKILVAEFRRCGIEFKLAGRRIIDAMEIYHQRERRDLSAAVQFYTGQPLQDAHRADVDVQATIDVLEAQIERYGLPGDVDGLALAARKEGEMDIAGNFVMKDGEVRFAFGKNNGMPLNKVDFGYLTWFQKQSFFDDAQAIVASEIERRQHHDQTKIF